MSVCLYSSLSCMACKAHLFYAALYEHVWPVWLCDICPHLPLMARLSGVGSWECTEYEIYVLIFFFNFEVKHFSF